MCVCSGRGVSSVMPPAFNQMGAARPLQEPRMGSAELGPHCPARGAQPDLPPCPSLGSRSSQGLLGARGRGSGPALPRGAHPGEERDEERSPGHGGSRTRTRGDLSIQQHRVWDTHLLPWYVIDAF